MTRLFGQPRSLLAIVPVMVGTVGLALGLANAAELESMEHHPTKTAVVVLSLVLIVRLLVVEGPAMKQASRLGVRLQQAGFPTVVRRVIARQRVDDTLDFLRFKVDAFPHGVYQPVAALPARTAKRADGCQSRLDAIVPVLSRLGVADAVDVGANVGYFPLNLSSRGIPTIAVDGDPAMVRTALYAVRRSDDPYVGVLYLKLRPDNVSLVPAADCTICLSVWHHLVREYGLDDATTMLAAIWRQTAKVLIFDTGENEMPESFGLPDMTSDPRAWLSGYLSETCRGSRVEHLSRHAAFDADGRPCERELFAIIRAENTAPTPSVA